MGKHKSLVPKENLAIFELLYGIEVGLRELIVQSLEATVGPRWWKERLPGDVSEEYKKGRECEQKIRWCQLVPHHPVYYVEFPSLKKVIERRDNWKDTFSAIFKRKEILINTLSELEPIRNKIAHNRKATPEDLHIVKGAYDKIVAPVGEKCFCELLSRCTLALDLPVTLSRLQIEAEEALQCCITCRLLHELQVWKETDDTWWFDETYLGGQLNSVREYFSLLGTYRELPRTRGSGHKIEAWVKSSNLKEKYAKAKEQLSQLLNNLTGG